MRATLIDLIKDQNNISYRHSCDMIVEFPDEPTYMEQWVKDNIQFMTDVPIMDRGTPGWNAKINAWNVGCQDKLVIRFENGEKFEVENICFYGSGHFQHDRNDVKTKINNFLQDIIDYVNNGYSLDSRTEDEKLNDFMLDTVFETL